MSQQAHIWSRYHAAAIQTHGNNAERAAEIADEALAQYNKRFETLAKLEHELAEAQRLLELRDEQVYIGVRALMLAEDITKDMPLEIRRANTALSHQWQELEQLVNYHLRAIDKTWIVVPMGMDPKNPKLRTRR